MVTGSTLSKSAVPEVNPRVRRRHYDETRWLVEHNDWYEIDELADAVWLACEQSLTVEQIVEQVAADQGLPLNEALAATVYLLERFSALGFIQYAHRD